MNELVMSLSFVDSFFSFISLISSFVSFFSVSCDVESWFLSPGNQKGGNIKRSQKLNYYDLLYTKRPRFNESERTKDLVLYSRGFVIAGAF
jgi:hypothetical protein